MSIPMIPALQTSTILCAACLATALACTAAMDLRTRRIPNLLVLAVLVGGMVVQAASGGWPALVGSISGMLVGLTALMPAYMMKGMGAGDIKLMAACGAWMSAPVALVAVALTLLVGLLMALLLTAVRSLDAWIANAPPAIPRLALRQRLKFPYAAAIAAGSLGALLAASGSLTASSPSWIR